jgi:hypothetical protein
MALIKDSKGRKEKETDSGYERVFGNRQLGMLISRVHATSIRQGSELEKFLASKLPKNTNIAIAKINKSERVFRDAKTDSTGKKHKLEIDCVIKTKDKIMIIEIKDGDTFDTKKVAGEVESLNFARDYISKLMKIPKDKISMHYCSFNARDHNQIEVGAKGLLGECKAMTGKELCELFDLDFNKIVQERKADQKANLDFFIEELKKIPEIHSKF